MSSSDRWPKTGGMRSGACFVRPTLVPLTAGPDGSALPTPKATRGGSATETAAMLPTPRARDWKGRDPNPRGVDLNEAVARNLLPTPAAHEPGGTLEQYHARLRKADGREPTFTPLSMLVQLLPTPTAMDSKSSGGSRPSDVTLTDAIVRGKRPQLLPTPTSSDGWIEGLENRHLDYAPAIRRWEHVFGRHAPAPTDDQGRLSPPFVEWMMGWPEGHVAGLTRSQALKVLGNGVVPLQAAAAYVPLLERADGLAVAS
jgi:DNA (cytosine-5)-methyltransferase 1